MNEEAKKLIKKSKDKDVKKNGPSGAYLDRIDYLVEKYKTALFFVFAQLLVILLLLFGYLNMKSNTTVEVLLPKIVKDTDYGKLKIGLNSSNKLYYKIMGNYISTLMLNSKFDNINENTIEFKKLLYPDVYDKYVKNIDGFKDFIINNKVKLSYKELSSNITMEKGKKALFSTKGILNMELGSFDKKRQICTTEVEMITKNYMLFVTAFSKTCVKLKNNSGNDKNDR